MDEQVRQEFVQRATEFLEANATRRVTTSDDFVWGEGPDNVRVMGSDDPEHENERLAAAAAWRAKAFDAGLAWAGGPAAYGGGGGDPDLNDLWRELEAEFEVPDQGAWGVAWDMVGPAVMAHGSDDLKHRFLGPIYRGDLLCSQLLSEPEAGSDLAGLKTRAVKDGDEWVVNGQKVWNSYAHKAKIGQLMARTDPDVPKHQGLTMFLLPLDSPGVEVRPLKQMTGEAEFNEVFLTDVRVPDANRVGEPGSGWRAVLTTLMSERASVGSGAASRSTDPVRLLTELARHLDRTERPDHPPAARRRAHRRLPHQEGRPARRRPAQPHRGRAGRRGVDPQAARLAAELPHRRARGRAARPVVRGRLGGVGHLLVEPVPVRRPGDAHRRRHRRDPAQHPG